MTKAFIKGVIWGGALSLVALGIVSVLVGPPVPSEAPEAAVATPAPVTTDPGAATPVENVTAAQSPISSAPAPDTLSALPQGATEPAAVPQVGAAETMATAADAPAAPAAIGAATAPRQAPPVAVAPAQGLVSPSSETGITVSTDPARTDPPEPTAGVALAEDPAQPAPPGVEAQAAPFAPVDDGAAQPLPEPSISTDPAQPPAPEVTGQTGAFDDAQTEDAQTPAAAQTEAAVETAASEPAEQAQPALSDAPIAAQTDAPGALAPVANPVLEQPALPAARGAEAPLDLALVTEQEALRPAPAEAALAPSASEDPAPAKPADIPAEAPQEEAAPDVAQAPSTPQATPPAPETEPAPAAEPDRPSAFEVDGADIPGRPAGTFGDLAGDVTTNRLPSLAAPAAPPAEDEALPQVADILTEGAAPPITRFAEPADNPDGKPLMAVVLIDEGADLAAQAVGLPALRSFPYPVSFAVDAFLPDATERMRAYRAEGFEVLALVDLPEGASARDAETALEVALAAVPEAVGVLEGVGSGIQGSRAAADQVTAILAQTGHGFVTQNKGLNTSQKLAAKIGVPSAVVFRDFDSAGQSPTVIRRFLDQAAFRAGQEGSVIMLGRLREDTISALLVWGLQSRASQVALVPVSGVLQTQE